MERRILRWAVTLAFVLLTAGSASMAAAQEGILTAPALVGTVTCDGLTAKHIDGCAIADVDNKSFVVLVRSGRNPKTGKSKWKRCPKNRCGSFGYVQASDDSVTITLPSSKHMRISGGKIVTVNEATGKARTRNVPKGTKKFRFKPGELLELYVGLLIE